MSAEAGSPVTAAAAARLVRAVLRAEGVARATISLALVGRRRIRALNRRHLGRDRDTDVIAFCLEAGTGARGHPNSGRGGTWARGHGYAVVGDVYVCVPVGAAQARRFDASPAEEIRRLVVHGVLHVLGYDHPSDGRRTTGPMWRRQEQLLARPGRREPGRGTKKGGRTR